MSDEFGLLGWLLAAVLGMGWGISAHFTDKERQLVRALNDLQQGLQLLHDRIARLEQK